MAPRSHPPAPVQRNEFAVHSGGARGRARVRCHSPLSLRLRRAALLLPLLESRTCARARALRGRTLLPRPVITVGHSAAVVPRTKPGARRCRCRGLREGPFTGRPCARHAVGPWPAGRSACLGAVEWGAGCEAVEMPGSTARALSVQPTSHSVHCNISPGGKLAGNRIPFLTVTGWLQSTLYAAYKLLFQRALILSNISRTCRAARNLAVRAASTAPARAPGF